MEFTLSQHAIDVLSERGISREWVAATMDHPDSTQRHRDDVALTHALRAIPEFGKRILRVVYNHTKTPPHVVTVYFDRTLRGKS